MLFHYYYNHQHIAFLYPSKERDVANAISAGGNLVKCLQVKKHNISLYPLQCVEQFALCASYYGKRRN